MSRYSVEHVEGEQTYGITFGWDRPLNTFFAQVEAVTEETDQASESDAENEDEEELLLDIGSPFDCLYTQVDPFYSALLEHLQQIGINDFSLSMEQKCQLLQDQDGIGN